MFVFSQSTGQFTKDGKFVAKGYSGYGLQKASGRQNPAMEHVVARGPIPRGLWKIGAPYNSKKVGDYALVLEPVGHNAHGRSAFRIHGDNRANNASNGCIILPRPIREYIWKSGDRDLTVVE